MNRKSMFFTAGSRLLLLAWSWLPARGTAAPTDRQPPTADRSAG